MELDQIQKPIWAITLKPEWAWAIFHAGKRIENRIWRPRVVGKGDWLAIHAGKRCCNETKGKVNSILHDLGSPRKVPEDLIVGAILGCVRLGCVRSAIPADSSQFAWWAGKPYWAWTFTEIRPAKLPEKHDGRQRLWLSAKIMNYRE